MPEDKNETIKEAFLRILTRETKEMFEKYLTHKLIGLGFLVWAILSLSGSIYRRLDNKCELDIQASKYFMVNLLCPIK